MSSAWVEGACGSRAWSFSDSAHCPVGALLLHDTQCRRRPYARVLLAVGCTQTGPTTSYEVTCLTATTFTNTTYSTSGSCTGPSTNISGTTPPCWAAAGADNLWYEAQTCVVGAYTPPSIGATATTYYGPDGCTPSASYVAQEEFDVG